MAQGVEWMMGEGDRGRAFVLFGGLLSGMLAGGWLGLVVAFVSGLAPSNPARFSGEDLLAVVIASALGVNVTGGPKGAADAACSGIRTHFSRRGRRGCSGVSG